MPAEEEKSDPLLDANDPENKSKSMQKITLPTYYIFPVGKTQIEVFLETKNYRGIEAYLNKFYMDTFVADVTLLLFPQPSKNIFSIYMMQDHELETPKLITLEYKSVFRLMYQCLPLFAEELDEIEILQFEEIVDVNITSLVLVPLQLRPLSHRAAVAVCLVNKKVSKVLEFKTQHIFLQIPTFAPIDHDQRDVDFIKDIFDDSDMKCLGTLTIPSATLYRARVLYILGRVFLHRINIPHDVLKLAATQLAIQVNAESASVYYLDHRNLLIPVYFGKTDREDLCERIYKSYIGIHCNMTICKSCRRRAFIHFANASSLTPLDEEMDKKFNYTTRCMMVAPIVYRDRDLFGVLEVNNKISEPRFSTLDEEVTKLIARDMSFVLRKHYAKVP